MEAKTKYLLWGLGAVAVATGGYFLFKHLQEKKDQKEIEDFKDMVSDGSVTVPSSSSSGGSSSPAPTRPSTKPVVYNQFPLKYGSKGTLVRDIQSVLVKRYGAKIAVDGDWGNNTENALKAKGLPTSFDSQAYAKFIAGTSSSSSGTKKPTSSSGTKGKTGSASGSGASAASISKQLHTAIEKDDIFSAVAALKKIKDKSKYNAVNTEFKKTRYWTFMDGYVSRTIVNALLDQFTSAEYKKKINAELYRIGLKYDGTKWSLSGLIAGTDRLITIAPTHVWDYKGNRMAVPRSTILGTFVRAKNGVTEFETLDGRILYTNTITIKYAA